MEMDIEGRKYLNIPERFPQAFGGKGLFPSTFNLPKIGKGSDRDSLSNLKSMRTFQEKDFRVQRSSNDFIQRSFKIEKTYFTKAMKYIDEERKTTKSRVSADEKLHKQQDKHIHFHIQHMKNTEKFHKNLMGAVHEMLQDAHFTTAHQKDLLHAIQSCCISTPKGPQGRYPKGSIDPITGKPRGGQWMPRSPGPVLMPTIVGMRPNFIGPSPNPNPYKLSPRSNQLFPGGPIKADLRQKAKDQRLLKQRGISQADIKVYAAQGYTPRDLVEMGVSNRSKIGQVASRFRTAFNFKHPIEAKREMEGLLGGALRNIGRGANAIASSIFGRATPLLGLLTGGSLAVGAFGRKDTVKGSPTAGNRNIFGGLVHGAAGLASVIPGLGPAVGIAIEAIASLIPATVRDTFNKHATPVFEKMWDAFATIWEKLTGIELEKSNQETKGGEGFIARLTRQFHENVNSFVDEVFKDAEVALKKYIQPFAETIGNALLDMAGHITDALWTYILGSKKAHALGLVIRDKTDEEKYNDDVKRYGKQGNFLDNLVEFNRSRRWNPPDNTIKKFTEAGKERTFTFSDVINNTQDKITALNRDETLKGFRSEAEEVKKSYDPKMYTGGSRLDMRAREVQSMRMDDLKAREDKFNQEYKDLVDYKNTLIKYFSGTLKDQKSLIEGYEKLTEEDKKLLAAKMEEIKLSTSTLTPRTPGATSTTPTAARPAKPGIVVPTAAGAAATTVPSAPKPTPTIAQLVTGGSPPAANAVDLALKMVGMHEEKDRQTIVEYLKTGGINMDPATTAWCTAFINSSLAQAGITGTDNIANSFQKWGIGITDPSQVQKGDVLVKTRGLGSGQMGGHLGLATGNIDTKTGNLEMVSGNTSNMVGKSWVNPSEVMIRRASAAEIKGGASTTPPTTSTSGAGKVGTNAGTTQGGTGDWSRFLKSPQQKKVYETALLFAQEAKFTPEQTQSFLGLLAQESNFIPWTKGDFKNNPEGRSWGPGQMGVDEAKMFGYSSEERLDPVKGTWMSGLYFQYHLKKSNGSIHKALLGYNGGGDPNYLQNVSNQITGAGGAGVPGGAGGEGGISSWIKNAGVTLASLGTDTVESVIGKFTGVGDTLQGFFDKLKGGGGLGLAKLAESAGITGPALSALQQLEGGIGQLGSDIIGTAGTDIQSTMLGFQASMASVNENLAAAGEGGAAPGSTRMNHTMGQMQQALQAISNKEDPVKNAMHGPENDRMINFIFDSYRRSRW